LDGAVATPGTALTATNSPAKPTVMSASRIARLVSVFIRDSFAKRLATSCEARLDNALRRPASLPYSYGSFYGDKFDSVPVDSFQRGLNLPGRMIPPKGLGETGVKRGGEDKGHRRPVETNQAKSRSVPDQAPCFGREPEGTPFRWGMHHSPRRRLGRRNPDPRCRRRRIGPPAAARRNVGALKSTSKAC